MENERWVGERERYIEREVVGGHMSPHVTLGCHGDREQSSEWVFLNL